MKTIYTAILGAYDTLKEPKIVTHGWKYICYTDQDFKSNIWHIVKIGLMNNDAARTARYLKIMFHEHIESDYSIWIDGSFIVNCNLNDWWEKHFNEPMTCITHPIRKCVYKEIQTCVISKRDDPKKLYSQLSNYRREGLPSNNGLIQSGILMRHKTKEVIEFCELWYNELRKYSKRDQVSFGYAAWKLPIPNFIHWDYRIGKEFQFVKHGSDT